MTFLTTFFSGDRTVDDRLSPILIKELRQGMRARAFVLSFLLLQVFLLMLVLGNLAAEDDRTALEFQNSFFWVIVGFCLLLLMPLRGLNAISQEIRRNTMETVMLTRLTAWRVVFGKWSALFAQSVLFVTAVLPYLVLRYFIGGNDIVADCAGLFFMLWLSGMLIAASIAVSALVNLIIRVILIVISGWMLSVGASTSFRHGSGMSLDNVVPVFGWLVIFGFFIPALLFELSATSIAPASENHASRRRILALSFFLSCSLLDWLTSNSVGIELAIPLLVLIGTCYFELSEKPRLLPRLVEPLRRYGPLGRLFALFLLPGWPSALLFSLVVIPGAVWINSLTTPAYYDSLSQLDVPLFIFSYLGSVLVPIAICHLLWRRMNQVFMMVALYNIILIGLASLLEGFAALTHTKINQVLALLPGLPILMTNMFGSDRQDFLIWCVLGNICTLIVVILLLVLASRSYFRELFSLLRTPPVSSATLSETKGPAEPS